MSSIQARLFLLLSAATCVVWLAAAGWICVSTQRELARALDARLAEAGRMVTSLVGSYGAAPGATMELPEALVAGYDHQLSCQIWSLDGRLIGRSASAPMAALASQADGISEAVIDGERWRVFAMEDPVQHVRVLVGDNLRVRERLVRGVLLGLLLPGALVLPVLAALIWFAVGRGLAPLNRLAEGLRRRDADDLRPLPAEPSTVETWPVTEALNGLFGRLSAARERERDFTAFAAHELRTPLAALRTQAQVALAAREEPTRAMALRQILVAVDRTSRLVRQLLDLSRLDAEAGTAPPAGPVDLRAMLVTLGQELAPLCRARDVGLTIDDAFGAVRLRVNEELLFTRLRNLAENAVQHTRSGGRATWLRQTDGAALVLVLEDEGPGIPRDELAMVRQRFFRGRHRSGIGTGLGLSIAELALQRAGAVLRLDNRPAGGGLRAEIRLPVTRMLPPCPDHVPVPMSPGMCVVGRREERAP